MTLSATRGSLVLVGLFTLVSVGMADTLGTYGDVSIVTGPDGNPAWQLTSSTAGAGYAGIYVAFSGVVTPATLTQLSVDYVMTTGTFGGGAPRFSLVDTTSNTYNEAYVDWGTPLGGGTFTDPNSGNTTYANTGNYADLASTDLRVQNNGYGNGIGCSCPYTTWSAFATSEAAVPMGFITIDLDGGFTPATTQVMDITNFDINGTIYTPGPAPGAVPEPATVGLMCFSSLVLAGLIRRRVRI